MTAMTDPAASAITSVPPSGAVQAAA